MSIYQHFLFLLLLSVNISVSRLRTTPHCAITCTIWRGSQTAEWSISR